MHFTITKIYISPAQNEYTNIKKTSAKRCFNFIVLLCTAEIENIQGLMKTLARWADFKSI